MDTTVNEVKRMKNWATSILIALALMYLILVALIHHFDYKILHYIKAFAEAGMVGALADWFAVTALLI